jgi:hypothetical protein
MAVCFKRRRFCLRRENADVLNFVESSKGEYTYTSLDLLALLKSITSVKTRMSIIELIVPRLVDPKSCQGEILELFRFVNDKEKVENLLRARAQAQNSSVFMRSDSFGSGSGSTSSPARSPAGGGRGGAGGRGIGAGRGAMSPLANSSSPLKSIFKMTDSLPSEKQSPSKLATTAENDGDDEA